jgi:hypothetical protein
VESECILSTWILLVWHLFLFKISGVSVTACDLTLSSSPKITQLIAAYIFNNEWFFEELLKDFVKEWSIFMIATDVYTIIFKTWYLFYVKYLVPISLS